MKKGWYIFLLFVPALLFSQENHSKKPKFYDRIQLIPEYQRGVYQDYYIYDPKPTSYPTELKENKMLSLIGGSIGYKNPYLFVTVGFFKRSRWHYSNYTRLQGNIGGNVLFFTKAAKNRSRLYVGPSFVISEMFYSYPNGGSPDNDKKDQFPLIGVGADVSFYNIHIRFSYQYLTQQFKNQPVTENNDRYLLFSIGYGFDLNTFRKKENKRFDL